MRKYHLAFTLIELLVVLAMLAVLAACLLPALARTRPQALRLACANNLKQVGIAFHTWALENDSNNPMNVAGGGTTMAANDAGGASGACAAASFLYQVFRCMSNELSTPKILFCPAEMDGWWSRYAATTFASSLSAGGTNVPFASNGNLSYFVGWDAHETSPRMFLSGDHSLGSTAYPGTTALAANPYRTQWIALGTNSATAPLNSVAWTDSSEHGGVGNVLLQDGSVEVYNVTALRTAVTNTADSPHSAGPGALPAGADRLGFP